MKKLIVPAFLSVVIIVIASCAVTPELITVTFMSDGSVIAAQSMEAGAPVSEPDDPERTGYIFDGWYTDMTFSTAFDFSNMLAAKDMKIYAKWHSSSDTAYTVEHYLQNVSGIGYTKQDTDNLSGFSGTTGIAVAKEYTGFTILNGASGTILGDGSLVLKLFYDRHSFTVSYESNGGSSVDDTEGVLYNATITQPIPIKVGYFLTGWYTEVGLTNSWDFSTDTVTEDMTLFAKWEVAKLIASDGAADDRFGTSVAISGDYAIIGANYDEDFGAASGSAHIFKRDSTTGTWDTGTKITAADGAATDFFGNSVAISDDYAIVSAMLDDNDLGSDAGCAYIFEHDSMTGNWDTGTKITASDGADGDYFSTSVAISGDYAIVGSKFDDDDGANSGSVYIFKKDSTSGIWDTGTKITASDGAANDNFGVSVAISGDYAIVGAVFDDDDGTSSGSAYIFKRDSATGNWDAGTKITASDGAANDFFGVSVAISGDYAIVGAEYDDDNGSNSGSAYIYKRDSATGNWDAGTKITAADGAENDLFGSSVAISGDYAIVGAVFDDDDGTSSGSTYIFKRDNITGDWDAGTKITAVDGAAEDQFGISVAISGNFALAGALYDDDNGADSGSTYVIDIE